MCSPGTDAYNFVVKFSSPTIHVYFRFNFLLERLLAGVEPDVLDEGLLALEHAVAVRALEVGRLVLQVVLPQLTRVPEALLTNLAEMLVREVDPVGVDCPGGPVGQDLVAVLALDLHRLVLVHQGDVLAQVAPVGGDTEVK